MRIMKDKIKNLLENALQPDHIQVEDESHRHRNHAEAQKHGGGHFKVCIVSAAFDGQPQLARHRAVYAAAQPLIDAGAIHALRIKARTPQEWSQHNG